MSTERLPINRCWDRSKKERFDGRDATLYSQEDAAASGGPEPMPKVAYLIRSLANRLDRVRFSTASVF